MSSSEPESCRDRTSLTAPSPEFIAVFREHAGADGTLSFARFMELALYHEKLGYYARMRRRIGRDPDADFFTSSSLGPVFGELVAAACVDLLGPPSAGASVFVEIGTEPAGPGTRGPAGVLAPSARGVVAGLAEAGPGSSVAHPFDGFLNISLGQPLAIPSRAIVFSNELFDAQPCHRLVHHAGCWREIGVSLRFGRWRKPCCQSFPQKPEPRRIACRRPRRKATGSICHSLRPALRQPLRHRNGQGCSSPLTMGNPGGNSPRKLQPARCAPIPATDKTTPCSPSPANRI